MGRIKSVAIKNLAMDLMEDSADKFSNDFEKNKKVVDGMKHIESKKIRNVVAGRRVSSPTQAATGRGNAIETNT